MTNQKQKTPNKTWYNGGCCSRDHVSYNFYEGTDIDIVPRYTLGYVPEEYELDADEYYEDGGIVSYIDNSENRITFLYGVTIHYLRAWDGEESSIMWVNQDKTIDYRD